MANPFQDPFNSFVDQLKQGTTPMVKQDPTVVVDDSEPSAIGGLAALGASVIGTGVLARRLPFVKNLLKRPTAPKSNFTYKPNKVVEEVPNIPTATGQSTELVTTAPVPALNKTRFNEVMNIPLTQGRGYSSSVEPGKNFNPIVGSAAYDRIMEAPFDVAPAKDWMKWLAQANTNDLKINSGWLQGVSRRVTPDELDELNIVSFERILRPKAIRDVPGQQPGRQKFEEVMEPKGGFLKVADENNLPVDRETLLTMVKNSPINDLKTLRLGVRGNPDGDMATFKRELNEAVQAVNKEGIPEGEFSYLNGMMDELTETMFEARKGLNAAKTKRVQESLIQLPKALKTDPKPFQDLLVKFNRITGDYNRYSKELPINRDFFNLRRDKANHNNFYPAYKTGMGYKYKMDAGENFTEDVIYYSRPVPNTKSGKFYSEEPPHYIDNEIGFIRYDDLPNPKLGAGKRHIRVSEVQTDLHSQQFASDADVRSNYFKNKVNPFNIDAPLNILRNERKKLLDQIAPYQEIGRGIAGLTRKQQQELARVNYEIGQLEKQSIGKFLQKEPLSATTAAPLAKAWPDYAVKNLLRTMAERKINAISIVPSPMNKGVKMASDFSGKIGDEVNYGLMDGKALIRDKNGNYKKTKDFAAMVAPLDRMAKQYGAKFEMFPMPKSNPNKRFKVIYEYTSKDSNDLLDNFKSGKAHYTKKIGDEYIYEDHLAAADTYEEALTLAKLRREQGNIRGSKIIIKEMGPDNPDNYEMVPTLIANDEVLKKFLLPMKAYMYEGGFVADKNIFASLL